MNNTFNFTNNFTQLINDYTIEQGNICLPPEVFNNKDFYQNLIYSDIMNTLLKRISIVVFICSILLILFWFFSYRSKRFDLLNFKEKLFITMFSLLYNGISVLTTAIIIMLNVDKIIIGIITLIIYIIIFMISLYYISMSSYNLVYIIRTRIEENRK